MIPPARILVGVDFSHSSRAALDFSARLARQCHAALHLAHVEDPLLLAVARDRGVDLEGQTASELLRLVAEIAPDLDATYDVGAGDAVRELAAEAVRAHADLVVAGAHGMSGAARVVFGSMTQGLLRHATCPVLVVPDGWTPPAPRSRDLTGVGPVICAIDLTLPAVEAAKAGARLAACLSTGTQLLHVVPQLRVMERWQTHADEALERQVRLIRHELEHAVASIPSTGRPLMLDIEIGRVPEQLAKMVAGHPDSLLVMGRTLRGNGASPPGSNASRVLGLTNVPVLMHVTQE